MQATEEIDDDNISVEAVAALNAATQAHLASGRPMVLVEDLNLVLIEGDKKQSLANCPAAESHPAREEDHPMSHGILRVRCDSSGSGTELFAEVTNGEEVELLLDDIPAWFDLIWKRS
jgi:hypothetical protein